SDANGESLLQQAIDRLLTPVTNVLETIGYADALGDLSNLGLGGMLNDLLGGLLEDLTLESLVVGEAKEFTDPYNKVALANDASYVKVAKGELLSEILEVAGAYQLLEDNNLTGLIGLLAQGEDGGDREQPGPIYYPSRVTTEPAGLYPSNWWSEKQAEYAAAHADEFFDQLFMLLYGKPFGGGTDNFLGDLINGALYTQGNFDAIVGLLREAIPEIALDQTIIPGRTLADVLASAVTIDGERIDVVAILDHIRNWQPSGPVTNKASFVKELVDYLAPLAPVLSFMLAGEDIEIADGLFKATGYDGYRYGVIPLLEMLLLPFGEGNKIVAYEDFAALSGAQQIEAILSPILDTLDRFVEKPADTLLNLLPGIVYFISPQGTGELGSPLQQSVERILYSINFMLEVTDLSSPIVLNVDGMIDDALSSIGLKREWLEKLIIGQFIGETSRSGGQMYYLTSTVNDRADIITALVRVLIDMLATKAGRNALIDLLGTLGLDSATLKQVNDNLGWILSLQFSTSFGKDVVLSAIYTLAFRTGKTVKCWYNFWTCRNDTIKDIYSSLLSANGEDGIFFKLNQWLNNTFADIFTLDSGKAYNGYIPFFEAIIAYFTSLFDSFLHLFS
ncbi:MAG: hypothetical protein LBB67_03545, partial [Oscillospiraceae bacterium]|nr:hypothetical protein [Oscillospiraceae bacterium]